MHSSHLLDLEDARNVLQGENTARKCKQVPQRAPSHLSNPGLDYVHLPFMQENDGMKRC